MNESPSTGNATKSKDNQVHELIQLLAQTSSRVNDIKIKLECACDQLVIATPSEANPIEEESDGTLYSVISVEMRNINNCVDHMNQQINRLV